MPDQQPSPLCYVNLTRREAALLSAIADEVSVMLQNVVLERDTEQALVKWMKKKKKRGLEIWRGEAPTGGLQSPNFFFYKASTTISTSVEALLGLMVSRTDKEFKQWARLHFKDEFLASEVIRNVDTSRSASRRYLGLKWLALRVGETNYADRDFCFLEFCDVLLSPEGQIAIFGQHSLNLQYRSAALPHADFVRGHFGLHGFVMQRQEGEERTLVTYLHQCDMKSHQHDWQLERRIEERMFCLERIKVHFHPRERELYPSCELCGRTFDLFHPQYRCKRCEKALCGRCSRTVKLSVKGVAAKAVRCCSECAIITKHQHLFNSSTARRRSSLASLPRTIGIEQDLVSVGPTSDDEGEKGGHGAALPLHPPTTPPPPPPPPRQPTLKAVKAVPRLSGSGLRRQRRPRSAAAPSQDEFTEWLAGAEGVGANESQASLASTAERDSSSVTLFDWTFLPTQEEKEQEIEEKAMGSNRDTSPPPGPAASAAMARAAISLSETLYDIRLRLREMKLQSGSMEFGNQELDSDDSALEDVYEESLEEKSPEKRGPGLRSYDRESSKATSEESFVLKI